MLESLFNKAACLKAATLLKRDPVNIAKFLRTAFFIEHLRWLLLQEWEHFIQATILNFFKGFHFVACVSELLLQNSSSFLLTCEILNNQGFPDRFSPTFLEICDLFFFSNLSDYMVFFGPSVLAGRVLWNRVCLSFRPSVLPSVLPSVRAISWNCIISFF